MKRYIATVLPGLEQVLAHEIRAKLAGAHIEFTERGKVYFASGLPEEALMVLRTADNLYQWIHRFQVGLHKLHLAGIEQEISRLDLSWIKANRIGTTRFKVNASRVGKHTYSRFEAAEAAARGIGKRNSRFRPCETGMHEVEFRMDVQHDEAVLAVRLTDASYRFRGEERRFTQAALRPTVAHALVWLSDPQRSDVFIDPCCGSGTIMSERLTYPYLRVEGGDLSREAVASAAENIGHCERAKIHHWNARSLPIDAGCVDKIVTNLPFGKQIAANEDILELYLELFGEMKRVLKMDGSAICLTDAEAALQSAAERAELDCSKTMTLHLKGLHPALFVLRKQS
ncbi:methyltransferase domain-containing protein [Paenibacillus allorhizosphaerae]|uniref:Ribosomal RNA large subunit methyltransferase K/L n=1 Tax=Paenibacillus allorhizosphaerae TaxID=2849866 RepID=A0ABN7TG29_9BACL|nr:methyltransferase domain-containing protein [Paenibacillus allorhizosphaerae]CAG7626521.1 Ribosomal RNA large subunit methyltransferase K/L [Paenibacillus allorhizosphaerae]